MKTQRQAKIMEIISTRDIETQEQLLEALQDEGFYSTQATISRDITNTITTHIQKTLSLDNHSQKNLSQESIRLQSVIISKRLAMLSNARYAL